MPLYATGLLDGSMTLAFARAEPIRLREWQSAWDGDYLTIDERMSATRSVSVASYAASNASRLRHGPTRIISGTKIDVCILDGARAAARFTGLSAIVMWKNSVAGRWKSPGTWQHGPKSQVFRTASSGRSNAVFNVVRYMSVEKALPFTSLTDSACLWGSWPVRSAQRSTMDRSEEVATH